MQLHEDIELNHFERSKEWTTISEILADARVQWLAICTDKDSDLERIRFAQGALEMIEVFLALPDRIFRGEEENNGRRTQ